MAAFVRDKTRGRVGSLPAPLPPSVERLLRSSWLAGHQLVPGGRGWQPPPRRRSLNSWPALALTLTDLPPPEQLRPPGPPQPPEMGVQDPAQPASSGSVLHGLGLNWVALVGPKSPAPHPQDRRCPLLLGFCPSFLLPCLCWHPPRPAPPVSARGGAHCHLGQGPRPHCGRLAGAWEFL